MSTNWYRFIHCVQIKLRLEIISFVLGTQSLFESYFHLWKFTFSLSSFICMPWFQIINKMRHFKVDVYETILLYPRALDVSAIIFAGHNHFKLSLHLPFIIIASILQLYRKCNCIILKNWSYLKCSAFSLVFVRP